MVTMTRQQWIDLGERVGATAAEAGLGVLITWASGIPAWWAALMVPALSAAKGWLATKATGSASLARPKTEPPSPTPGG